MAGRVDDFAAVVVDGRGAVTVTAVVNGRGVVTAPPCMPVVVCDGFPGVVGAGSTCVAALTTTTAGDDNELIENSTLMLAVVSNALVVAACTDPPSCSMIAPTVDVGVKSLLADVC